MITHDLDLTAYFYVKKETEDWISPDQVEQLLHLRRPDATTSWEIGRKYIEAEIKRMQEMGCPPLILKSSEHLLDKNLHISIPIEGSNSRLEGFTTGFSYYDGCMGLDCVPFDMRSLQRGAKALAVDFDLDFKLRFGGVGDLDLWIVPEVLDFEGIMNWCFDGVGFVDLHTEELSDWKSLVRSGIRKWLEKHPDPNLVARWISVMSPDTLASKVCQRIESVDDIISCGRGFYGDAKYGDNFLVCYREWTAIMSLTRVPEPLFT